MQLLTDQVVSGLYTTEHHGGRGHIRLWGTIGAGVKVSLVWAEDIHTPTKLGPDNPVFEVTDGELQAFFELPAGQVGVLIEGDDIGTLLSVSIHKLPAT